MFLVFNNVICLKNLEKASELQILKKGMSLVLLDESSSNPQRRYNKMNCNKLNLIIYILGLLTRKGNDNSHNLISVKIL